MGFGIALQAHAFRSSQFTLAGSLWLLAAFGLTHGLVEWGFIFIPLHAQKFSEGVILYLKAWQMFLTALSYYFLFLFGFRLLERAKGNLFLLLRWIPAAILSIWFINFIFFRLIIAQADDEWWLIASDIWARYLLALPGSLLTSYALFQQIREVERLGMPHVIKNLVLGATSFAIYALVGGFIVPRASFLPAAVVNMENFFRITGIPVQVFRAAAGFIIAYSIIRVLEIFDLENRRRLEEAEKYQAVFQERTRIAQDLHDTIIQSVYAIGLNLENCLYLVDEDKGRAKQYISETLGRLNTIIAELRNYIMNLKPVKAGGVDIVGEISQLVEDFTASSSLAISLNFTGVPPTSFNPYYAQNLCQIIREALSNTLRHAQATEVRVQVQFQERDICVIIIDNGIGFDPIKVLLAQQTGTRHGLLNMTERAAWCGGSLHISSRPGRGATLTVTIPYGVEDGGTD